jgi:NDP-sugar pyrophosphorylase family protein
MLLAAGYGERLKPFTEKVPKPLLPVANRPIIDYVIEALAGAGVRRILINVHHLGEQIADYVGRGERWGVAVTLFREARLLGTGGGIANMLGAIEGRRFLCVNGDTLLPDAFSAWLRRPHPASDATMLVLKMGRGESEAPVFVDRDAGRLIGFSGDDGPEPKGERALFCGVHIFDRAFLQARIGPRAAEQFCIIRAGYRRWLNESGAGKPLGKPRLRIEWGEGPLLDTGTTERWLRVQRHILDRQPRVTEVNAIYRVIPPAGIAPDAQVGEGSVIGPYVAVGAGCRIGRSCLLDNAILMPGAVVGDGSKLSDRILA